MLPELITPCNAHYQHADADDADVDVDDVKILTPTGHLRAFTYLLRL